MNHKLIKSDEFEFSQISGRLVIRDSYCSLSFNIWRDKKSNMYSIFVHTDEQVIVDYLVSNNICVINKRYSTEFQLILTPQTLLELI